MRLALTTAPTEEPISLAAAKRHLRVDEDATDEDALILDWIASARKEAERAMGRPLVTQTWTGYLNNFPDSDEIEIPLAPLISVTSIKYTDPDGVEATFSTADYTVDTSGVLGRIYLNYNESWPDYRIEYNAVRIVFVAGYGDASTVPEDVKSWMLLRIGERYEHREGTVVGTIATRLPDISGLVAGDRIGF
jgi:uncharacterized phiE125 gp8 family phage protein